MSLKRMSQREQQLLWDSYMALDHGDHDERLKILNRLEKYFDEQKKDDRFLKYVSLQNKEGN